jgi:hypothetical protein
MMTSSKILKTGQLHEFIARKEARGIGPAKRREVEAAIKTLATTPTRPADRTSYSPSGDGSN